MAMPQEKNTVDEFQRLNQLGAEDPSLKDTLITMFLEQAPGLLQSIRDTAQSFETVSTKNAAHTFKGVCLNLGFESLGKTCKEIEDQALENNFDNVNNLLKTLESDLQELSNKLKEML